MSIINKAMTFARSPQGRDTISRLTASRGAGTTGRRPGRRGKTAAPAGLGGVFNRIASGAARGRRR